jgi:hypothetical protein
VSLEHGAMQRVDVNSEHAMTIGLRHVKAGGHVAAASNNGFSTCGIGAGDFLGTEAGASSSPRSVRRPSSGCHMGLIIGLRSSTPHHLTTLESRLILLLSCQSRDRTQQLPSSLPRERNISTSTPWCAASHYAHPHPCQTTRPASSLRVALPSSPPPIIEQNV